MHDCRDKKGSSPTPCQRFSIEAKVSRYSAHSNTTTVKLLHCTRYRNTTVYSHTIPMKLFYNYCRLSLNLRKILPFGTRTQTTLECPAGVQGRRAHVVIRALFMHNSCRRRSNIHPSSLNLSISWPSLLIKCALSSCRSCKVEINSHSFSCWIVNDNEVIPNIT